MDIFQSISYLLLFIGGSVLGFRLLKGRRHVEVALICLILISFFIGVDSYLVRFFRFELVISNCLVSVFFGLLAGRLISRCSRIKSRA